MRFEKFKEIVRGKYPEAEVFAHGEFGNRNKINVTIVFEPNTKCYSYNGTYCEVLNRIGIKAIYPNDLASYKQWLEYLQKSNGTKGWFGEIVDNSKEIKELENKINDIEENYLVV